MKARLYAFCILISLLLPAASLAELSLRLSDDEIAAESPLDFTVSGTAAEAYRYAVLHEGKELFATETPMASGSYLPRQEGAYTLRVSAGEDEAEAHFTVTPRLTCQAEAIPQSLQAGDPLKVRLQPHGGVLPYRFLYLIQDAEGETIVRQESGDSWCWAPAEAGEYTLRIVVMDAQGTQAATAESFTVEPGPGLSVEECGGALYGHGGQKSWAVYSPGAWMAATTADFIQLVNAQGNCGDALTITVEEETSAYREGTIRVSSAGRTLEWTVAQPAAHGVDEEVFLFAAPEGLYIDGKTHVAWVDAQGARSFAVSASADWEASTQDDFIQLTPTEDALEIIVTSPQEAAARSGLVTLQCGAAAAYIHVYQSPAAAPAAAAPPDEPFEAESMPLYSQFSGLWKERKYGASTLEHSGCAIFALSHALHWLGYEGEAIEPDVLAKKYAFCLRDGGTVNSTLVGNAGDDLGFKTRYDLYKNLSDIRKKLDDGAVFSFAVVNGHIALAVEQSDDGSMMRILDSAPSATWERIKNAQLYRQEADGSFAPVASLSELDGARYYIENDAYGALTYWLETDYVAKRGVRLIQPRE